MTIRMPEQICRHTDAPGYRKFIKRETARRERRIGKRLLDAAPKQRRFNGYS